MRRSKIFHENAQISGVQPRHKFVSILHVFHNSNLSQTDCKPKSRLASPESRGGISRAEMKLKILKNYFGEISLYDLQICSFYRECGG